jgi:hypothetical protein
LQYVVYSPQLTSNSSNTKSSKVLFYPMLPDFPYSIALWKSRRLRQFDLDVRDQVVEDGYVTFME